MHNLCFFYCFCQKLLFAENYFLIAAINLSIRGPLYTCLVYSIFTIWYQLRIDFIERNTEDEKYCKTDCYCPLIHRE